VKVVVPEEAGAHLSFKVAPKPFEIPGRELEALDQKRLGLFGTDLRCLANVWVHVVGEHPSIDRVPVERVQIRQYPAQHRPDDVGGEPSDAFGVEQPLSKAGLAL
jgi:hypothetical protein